MLPQADILFLNEFELSAIARLSVAIGLGALFGLERERKGQAAGLRTHMVLCAGACIVMIVSEHLGILHGSDPARIAAQVVSGVGFLGAGTIMRYGTTVRGLTTAACLWTVSGIGLAVGAKLYTVAIASTLLVLLALTAFARIERFIESRKPRTFEITCNDVPGILGRVEEALARGGIRTRGFGIERDLVEKRIVITAQADTPEGMTLSALGALLSNVDGVTGFDID